MLRRHFRYNTHKRLKDGQVRLITLLPGDEATDIKCRMRTAALSDNPLYEALSYQWCVDWRDDKILLHGRKFHVRYNLLAALRHLRHPVNPRVLWIDAICINQSDLVEKKGQIEQMGQVYSQASRVVVWLGGECDNSRVALDFLRQVAQQTLSDEEITSIFKAHKYPTLDLAMRQILCGRSYWDRLWILQEILLGTADITLHFGLDAISWQTLRLSIERLKHYLNSLAPEPKYKDYLSIPDLRVAVEYGVAAKLDSIKNLLSSDGNSTPGVLRLLLGLAQRAKCCKWSDKIFGLLGMVDFSMPVDYDKKPFELYSESMHYFKNALLINPRNDPAIHTMKLNHILQGLLKNPSPDGDLTCTISCVKMTGVLSGKMLQVEGSPGGFLADAPRHDPNATDSREYEDIVDEVNMRLQAALDAVHKSTGQQCQKPPELSGRDLIYNSRDNLIRGCSPHYFHAARTPGSSDLEMELPISAPRVGKVPLGSEVMGRAVSMAKLFAASRIGRQSTCGTSGDNEIDVLIGTATPNARNGDVLVRFLESEVCFVLRDHGTKKYEYVGCAMVPESGDSSTDVSELERTSMNDSLPIWGSALSYDQFDEALRHGHGIDIMIDLETLQFITNVRHSGIGNCR